MKTLWLTLAIIGLAVSVQAQGTVSFLNSALSKIKMCNESTGGVAVDAPVGTVVGLFWGETAGNLSLVPNTVVMTSPGLFNGGVVYGIPGTVPGQRVHLLIAAWLNRTGPTPSQIERPGFGSANITDYGESSVVAASLGPTPGPGTVIWQGAVGVHPERMKPFIIGPLTPCPEPSVVAIGAMGLLALLWRRCRG